MNKSRLSSGFSSSTPMTLLNLPNELLIQILSHLNHQDLIACQLSDKALHNTIKHSILLQFQIALSTFKATDNPSCHLSVSERLKALKDSEIAWTYLHKDFRRRIAIDFEVSGIYDLSGGVFLLGNATRTALHYIKLPSSIVDHVEWKNIELNHSEGMVIDMGFCIHEHDLLAVVTTKPRHAWESHTTYDIKIILFKLSTGEPHPSAKESTIHVLNSNWNRPAVGIEIVGDRLVLILTYHHNLWMPDDRVFVYDWRNAVQTMSFTAPYCSYSGLVFLSENLVVIPNAQTNALEIWDIFSTHTIPRPACILQLPELAPGNSLLYITCRGEPNPVGAGSYPQSDKPFYHSADEAIILFHIRVQLGDPIGHQLLHGGDIIPGRTFTLFVHRNALCDIYERHCAEMNTKMEDSFGRMSTVQVERSMLVDSALEDFDLEDSDLEDEDVGSEMIDGEDEGYDDEGNHDSESAGSENEDDVLTRATDNDPIPIHWFSWGPPIAHWFSTDISSTQWITTSAGQRAVFMKQSNPGMARSYVVLDFNPESLRRLEVLPLDRRPRIQCFRHWEEIQAAGLFKHSLVGGLPFVAYTSENVYVWDGALIDEERVLGLEAEDGHISVIEVHHFGGTRN